MFGYKELLRTWYFEIPEIYKIYVICLILYNVFGVILLFKIAEGMTKSLLKLIEGI